MAPFLLSKDAFPEEASATRPNYLIVFSRLSPFLMPSL